MTSNTTDVLIIGAGPAGLLLANLLGQYGRSAIVVEKLDELIDYPRAIGIDDESLRSMQTAGLADAVAAHISPQHAVRVVNGRGRIINEMNPTTQEFGWSRRNGFIQPMVDRILFDALERFPDVEARLSTEAVAIAEHDSGVRVTVTGPTGSYDIDARYVVGCEGGRSFTRRTMGVDFVGVTTPNRWLVVDVDNDPLGTPNAVFGADPRRPHGSFGLPHGVRRWEFLLHANEPDSIADDDDFVRGLIAPHAPDTDQVDILRRRMFTHNARVASGFRRGRLFLAGDAAHLMPTWAGQGWNSCIRDATNLSWKLAAVLDGTADDALLDSYDAERRPHAQAMVDLSLTMGKIFGTTSRLTGLVRDGALRVLDLVPPAKRFLTDMRWKPMPFYQSGVVVDPSTSAPGANDGRVPTGISRSLIAKTEIAGVGRQFPQPRVNAAGHDHDRLDDVLGLGWSVLVWGNEPADLFSTEARAQLNRLGAKLVRIVPENRREWTEQTGSPDTLVIGDVTGDLKLWFDDRPFSVVFLRPDRFIAAVSLTGRAERTLAALLAAASIPAVTETAAINVAR